MPSRSRLEALYGPAGADLLTAAPGARIAAQGATPVHVHLREDASLGDDILRIVARLRSLEELVANGTAVTDAGLGALRELTSLRRLHLGGTGVGDAAIDALLALPLTMLDLTGTKVSAAGFVRLREGLPGCALTGDRDR